MEDQNSNPIYGIKTADGQERIISQPGTYTQFNKLGGTYTPGSTQLLRDGKIFSFTTDLANPYKVARDIILVEVSLPFIFCNINNQFYTFRTSEDSEGRTLFSTSRTYYAGISDNQERSYQVFLSLISDNTEIEEAKQLKIDSAKTRLADAAEKQNRINLIKQLRAQAGTELQQALLTRTDLANITQDVEINEICHRYFMFDLILIAL